ncbi:MAG: flagellar biosynthesis anti-sigma factor FlgM [Planctomycetota bacterium]|jgi:anti-sigma28 factor (negative regulator of flagellin synthesis)|nr:MAG: flagellar biosynthesis anti-sigma factor FlgM [Planctomycetota bacterium]RLS95355.1 MAG: flagellar biosynthesis anti-sigma factor FlgM [Planctomycetota bacterium]
MFAAFTSKEFAMSEIGNIGGKSSLSSAYATGVRQSVDPAAPRMMDTTTATPTRTMGDRVEVSEVARWLGEMNRLPAIRESKVAAAKASIANGTLDNDERLATAVQSMLDDVM